MAKPPKKKWKSLAAKAADKPAKERVFDWADRWFRIEKASLKARIGIVHADRIEEQLVSRWLDTPTDRGAQMLAAVLSRTVADDQVICMLASAPRNDGLPSAVAWGRSREGEFFAREYWIEVGWRHSNLNWRDLDERAFAEYDDFTEPGFLVDPGLEDALARKGCPGAVKRAPQIAVPLAFAQASAPAIIGPEEERPKEERAPEAVDSLQDFPWESVRLHEKELDDLVLGPIASEPFAFSPGAKPEGWKHRSLDELVRHGWVDEADALVLVPKVMEARDVLAALRFFLGSDVPPLAKTYACACAAHHGRVTGDRKLATEAGAALVQRVDAMGPPAAWLEKAWTDDPSLREIAVTCATACLELAAFWRIAQVMKGTPSFPLPETSPILRARLAAEEARDLLLEKLGAKHVAEIARGETRLAHWIEDAYFAPGRSAPLVRRGYVALQAAILHAVIASVELQLQRGLMAVTHDGEDWRPDRIALDGLIEPGLEMVARHLVQRAGYAPDDAPDDASALHFLERARAACPFRPIFATVYDEARFRAGKWDEALLADLEKETAAPGATLGAAAEFLRVAERLQRPRESRVARKRLLALAKGTPLEWAARVRVAFGRPHVASELDRVIELELEAPAPEPEIAGFDPRERAVFALLGAARDGLADLVRQVTAQRLALEKPPEEEPISGESIDDWAKTVFARLRSVWPLFARSAGDVSSLRARALDLEARIAVATDRAPAEREAVERDVVSLLESAQAAPEVPFDLEEDADEDDFKRMALAPWALERSEKDLGTPPWALLKGMQAIARWNASRGQRRDVKRLQGFRQCELRLHDARHPVRVSYLLTSSGPVVVGIYAKQDESHQTRMLERIEGWLGEIE